MGGITYRYSYHASGVMQDPEALVHIGKDGESQDSAGRWYSVHGGGVPGAIDVHTKRAPDRSSVTVKLTLEEAETMRLLAVNTERRSRYVWGSDRLLSPPEADASRTRTLTLSSEGGSVPVRTRISNRGGINYDRHTGIQAKKRVHAFGPEVSGSTGLGFGQSRPGLYSNVFSGSLYFPPSPTSVDRTYTVTAYSPLIPWDVTSEVVVSAATSQEP